MTETTNIDVSIPCAFSELFEPKRYKVYYGGRGGAKSWAFADALLILGVINPLRILCAREIQNSIADSVHKLLADRIAALGLDDYYLVQEKGIHGSNGTEIFYRGLYRNVRGMKSTEAIDIVWVEEGENVSDNSWELLIPTMRKKGSEIWISFNPRNPKDATWKRFVLHRPAKAVVKKVSWRDNPYFDDTELPAERLRLMAADKEAYDHIWEGEFDTRYSGTIYGKWIADLQEKGRISGKVKHDPAYPVYTLWDLGYGDATAVWFYQATRSEVLFIDYFEDNGEDVGYYCDMLKGVVREAGGAVDARHAHRKAYTYHGHYVPQDAGKKLMEAGGRSIVEQAWKDHGVRMTVVPETTHANRHAGLRKLLPVCWFNEQACAAGLDALMSYRYEYDEEMAAFRKIPVHDWASHGSCSAELLPSVWHGRGVTVEKLKEEAHEREFRKRRREHRLEGRDPYRVKP